MPTLVIGSVLRPASILSKHDFISVFEEFEYEEHLSWIDHSLGDKLIKLADELWRTETKETGMGVCCSYRLALKGINYICGNMTTPIDDHQVQTVMELIDFRGKRVVRLVEELPVQVDQPEV